MPSVSINCPACKRSLRPTEDPPAGARMRCPYADCGTVFCYAPSANGTDQEAPAQVAPPDQGAEYELMADLLAEDEPPSPIKPGPKPLGPNPNVADEPISGGRLVPELPRSWRSGSRKIRQPVPGHPLAQASERSKDVLIGGKPVKFEEPRKYLGVFIAFLILAGGYGGFLAFSAFWKYYNSASQKRADDIAKRTKDAEDAKKKKFADLLTKLNPKQEIPAAAKTTPAAAANTASLAVSVESVRQGAFFPPDQREFLEVKLRITNESKVADHAAAWPGPQVVARLRGTGFVPYQLHVGPSQNTKIASGQSIRETLYFERTVPGHELTLELTIPQGAMPAKKQLKILPEAIQRGP